MAVTPGIFASRSSVQYRILRLLRTASGRALPSELRLREGSSTPSSRTHAPVWQLNPHERTHGLSSQTTEMGHKLPKMEIGQRRPAFPISRHCFEWLGMVYWLAVAWAWTANLGMPTYVDLTTGEPAPWFWQHCSANTGYCFDTTAGPYIVLCFFGCPCAQSCSDRHHSRTAAFLRRRSRPLPLGQVPWGRQVWLQERFQVILWPARMPTIDFLT